MRLLLDTHALIWLFYDTNRLSEASGKVISEADEVRASIVSLWEIAIKKAIGKLGIAHSVAQIYSTCAEKSIHVDPIEVAHLERIAQLPNIHKDPFDRLLVAQAQCEGMTIVTKDENIAKYDVQTVWQ